MTIQKTPKIKEGKVYIIGLKIFTVETGHSHIRLSKGNFFKKAFVNFDLIEMVSRWECKKLDYYAVLPFAE